MVETQLLPQSIQEWLAHLTHQGKSAHTLRGYQHDLADFCAWYQDSYGEEMDPQRILPRDVRDYQAYLQTVRRHAARTVNHRLVALSRFFKWATTQKIARQDPTASTRKLRLPARQPKALEKKDQNRLQREVQSRGSKRDIAIIEVLLGTGIRVSELLSLTCGDVEIHERSGKLTIRQGKGGQPRRVPLPSEARNALAVYLEELGPTQSEELLWHGQQGSLQDPSTVNRLLAKYARWAELEEVTPHTCRHTYATRYLEKNPGDLRGLASLLGHASLDTVMIYTEPTEEDLQQRVENL